MSDNKKSFMQKLKNSKVNDNTKSEDIELEIKEYEKTSAALKAEADRCEAAAADFKVKIDEKDEVIAASDERIEQLLGERDEINEALKDVDLSLEIPDAQQKILDDVESYNKKIALYILVQLNQISYVELMSNKSFGNH